MKTLHSFVIHGIDLAVYDSGGSLAAERVAEELTADAYGLRAIPFRPGDVVIDIGAHIGLVSIYLAKRFPFLRIAAYEPYPPNYLNCAENLSLNCIPNVRLNTLAVTADGRDIVLRCNPINSGGATALFALSCWSEAEPVPSTTLDHIFATELGGGRCRLLKLDCEGMEYEILPHACTLGRVDYLAAEFHEGELYSGGAAARTNHGAALALAQMCFRYVPPERARLHYCPKTD